MGLVLAWPEIGLAERVVPVTLPDRAAVERADVSVWEAVVHPGCAPTWTSELPADVGRARWPEEGRALVDPRVLLRSADAVVVLTRLSSYGQVWQVELVGYARGTRADVAVTADRGSRAPSASGRAGGLIAGLVVGDTVRWNLGTSGATTSGAGTCSTTTLATLPAPGGPAGSDVRLAVRWPAVGLPSTELVLRHGDLLPAAPG